MDARTNAAWLLLLQAGLLAAGIACAGEDGRILDEAYWIWDDKDSNAAANRKAEHTFAKEVQIDGGVKSARLRITAESVYALSVNGKEVGTDDKVMTLEDYDLKPFLANGKNKFEIKVTCKQWYAGLFVAGTVETADGKSLKVLSDATWDVSNAADPTVKKAETVIQGVNGGWWNNCNRLMEMPESWYRLNMEIAAPGIAWAKPCAGPKTKVLAVHPRASQRDTVELIQRTDMDVAAVFSDCQHHEYQYGGTTAPFFPETKGWLKKDVAESIAKALGNPCDVIVLGPVPEEVFYETMAGKLKELVGNGTGLVFTAIPGKKIEKPGEKKPTFDPAYEKELTATPLTDRPAFLATGTPFEKLPGFRLSDKDKDKDFRKVATLYQFGKGRVVKLNLGSGWGLFANANDPVDLHYEYYMSFAIKAILWAAAKEPALQFKNFPAVVAADHDPKGSGELAFEVSGAEGACALGLSVRSAEKLFRLPEAPTAQPGLHQGEVTLRPLHTAKAETKGDGPVKFALPPLPRGTYFLDVEAARDGKKANWATACLTVASRPDIAELKMAAPFIDVAEGKAAAVQARVTLSEGAPDGTTVRFALLDNNDRLLQQAAAEVPKGETKADGVFLVRGFGTALGRVRAELRAGDDVLAIAVGRFSTVRRDWDKFFLFGWSSISASSHATNVYARVLANLGLDAQRGMIGSLDTLEIIDTVALPGYAGMSRSGNDLNPEGLQKARERNWKIVRTAEAFDPVAYYTGDEIDYHGGDELPGRVLDLREALKKKYGNIGALNKQWDTKYASFDDVYPLTTAKEIKEADQGKLVPEKEFLATADQTRNYSRWLDQWLNNYRVFNDSNRVAHGIIKECDPNARVGVDCPMWEFARCGHDWYSHMKEFEMFAPYGREGETQPYEDARSFAKPASFLGLTYGGYLYNAFCRREQLTDVEWQRWRAWHGLLRGFTSIWWYNLGPGAGGGNIAPGFLPYPTLAAACEEIAKFRRGYYTLFSRLRRDHGPVAIHYSIPSRLASSIMPEFSECCWSDHFLMQILRNEAGHGYTFVADEQIAAGALKNYKAMMMSTAYAIGDAEAKELRKFVEGGGVLIADVRPGIVDDRGRWDEKGAVPALFGLAWKKELGRKTVTGEVSGEYKGVKIQNKAQRVPVDPAVELKGAKALIEIEGVPVVTCNDVGKGSAICLNIPFNYYRGYPTPDHLYLYMGDADHNRLVGAVIAGILKAHKIERVVPVDVAGSEWLWGLDTSCHTDGEAQYVGLTKKRRTLDEPDANIAVHLPKPGHVYDMLNAKYLGERKELTVAMKPAGIEVFGVLPYAVKGLNVTLKADSAARGEAISGTVAVDAGGAKPVRHAIHVEVVRPDGQAVRYLALNLETSDGSARFSVPLALNEAPGEYQLRFTDAATGIAKTVRASVK